MSDLHDVCVVGAGPGGATCAYYLAKQGKRVLLLDRHTFPREKLCGDAVVPAAQAHLREMGVLDRLLAANDAVLAAAGGFISPSGIECISSSKGNPRGLVMAVKRVILDERIVRAVQAAGAQLVERVAVTGAERSRTGEWTVHCRGGFFRARVLVAADGAQSRLARSLGLVGTAPDAICSRSFVEPGTHRFDLDGVCYMDEALLPGYAAIFRHSDDELGFCTYVLPGGKPAPRDVRRLHHLLLERNPFIRRDLGPHPRMERMKAAWIRTGGVCKSYADGLLLVGDAAGQVDPLTGEGIQFAMDAAKHAADTLVEAFAHDDFSERTLATYQRRWMASFGGHFRTSLWAARVMGRFPRTIDAMAAATKRGGDRFFLSWADVMTGARPWSSFLDPRLSFPIAGELAALLVRRPAPAPVAA